MACSGQTDFFDLARDPGLLKAETRHYVPKFLAVLKIFQNLDALGFKKINWQAGPNLKEVSVPGGTDLLALAQACNMRGGHWLLLLLGPATEAFALPIYEQRALIRRAWPTLLVGVTCGCLLALGGGWLLSGWLGLPHALRLSLLPRSFTTPFAMQHIWMEK